MNTSTTSYHFKIITSDEIMEVFGTVMSRTPESIVLDLWCPEEPRLNQRITTTNSNIPETVENLLRKEIEQFMPKGNGFSIQYLAY